MADTLTHLRLDEFLERLSSGAPTPGGGSASAFAGAMSAALLHMVLELTAGRPQAPDDEDLAALRTAVAGWQSELLQLAQADAAAYEAVVAARRLPRATDREAEARRVQLEAAVREAIRTPLAIARTASELLPLAERIAAVGNRNAISDVGVAGLLAAAAVRGAALNVRINLPSLPDGDDDAAREIDSLLGELEPRERAVGAAVEERLG